jgi:hypothetical protein
MQKGRGQGTQTPSWCQDGLLGCSLSAGSPALHLVRVPQTSGVQHPHTTTLSSQGHQSWPLKHPSWTWSLPRGRFSTHQGLRGSGTRPRAQPQLSPGPGPLAKAPQFWGKSQGHWDGRRPLVLRASRCCTAESAQRNQGAVSRHEDVTLWR